MEQTYLASQYHEPLTSSGDESPKPKVLDLLCRYQIFIQNLTELATEETWVHPGEGERRLFLFDIDRNRLVDHIGPKNERKKIPSISYKPGWA
jgi:hypothetical protein